MFFIVTKKGLRRGFPVLVMLLWLPVFPWRGFALPSQPVGSKSQTVCRHRSCFGCYCLCLTCPVQQLFTPDNSCFRTVPGRTLVDTRRSQCLLRKRIQIRSITFPSLSCFDLLVSPNQRFRRRGSPVCFAARSSLSNVVIRDFQRNLFLVYMVCNSHRIFHCCSAMLRLHDDRREATPVRIFFRLSPALSVKPLGRASFV